MNKEQTLQMLHDYPDATLERVQGTDIFRVCVPHARMVDVDAAAGRALIRMPQIEALPSILWRVGCKSWRAV